MSRVTVLSGHCCADSRVELRASRLRWSASGETHGSSGQPLGKSPRGQVVRETFGLSSSRDGFAVLGDPEAFAWTPVLCLGRARGCVLPAHVPVPRFKRTFCVIGCRLPPRPQASGHPPCIACEFSLEFEPDTGDTCHRPHHITSDSVVLWSLRIVRLPPRFRSHRPSSHGLRRYL